MLVGRRKLAGILAQRSPSGRVVVVGLGLNVGWAPPGAAGAASNRSTSGTAARATTGLPADIEPRYRARLDRSAGASRSSCRTGHRGTAVDVEADGRLVVLDACGVTHRIDVGDVVHVRAGPSGSSARDVASRRVSSVRRAGPDYPDAVSVTPTSTSPAVRP